MMYEVFSGWCAPDWPLPAGVKALQSMRQGGLSEGVYAANNLGMHVGDNPEHVAANRQRLRQYLPDEPFWLNQVHGTTVLNVDAAASGQLHRADAAISRQTGKVCVVMTADCLPVLLCSLDGREIAAVHAGWRGLVAGVLASAVRSFDTSAAQLMAYLCPAISGEYFEVGEEVKDAFAAVADQRGYRIDDSFRWFRKQAGGDKYLADLYQLARDELKSLGVARISGGDFCTYADKARFYSYRRDGVTGRMASLIWRE